jgi:hypothetical protein
VKQTFLTSIPIALALLSCPSLVNAQAADTPKIEIGFEQRVRNENWNNILDWSGNTDDQRNQVRWRTRLWTTVPLSSRIGVTVGLAQESNQIFLPRSPWKLDEIMFEKAYLDLHDLPVKGLTLRIGRQDLMRGENTYLLEGDPWDGSRTIYSNAAVLGYSLKKTKIEAIGIWNPVRDHFLPRIHNQNRLLVEWNEQAIGTYITNKSRPDTDIEAFYFLKKEFGDTRPKSNAQFQPDRHLHAVGGRMVHRFRPGWSAVGEAAVERGSDHAQRTLRGWAGDGYIKKAFAGRMKPTFQAGYWAFSGDDPRSPSTVEAWDPLFGRWPKWSEMYIYSQLREQGVAYWTNLGMSQVEAVVSPWKPISWRATWYHMNALHPFAGSPQIFGAGTARGNQLQTRLDFTINPSWRGHVLWEYHVPGDFYRGSDAGYFLRFEMIYSLKHLFAAKKT